MAKEILLYSDIYSYTAQAFMQAMEDASDEDVVLRINGDGGDPQYLWGMICKFAEHTKGKSIKIDGKAHSAFLFFCLFADDVEAVETAQLVAHRAAYPSWVESNPEYFTELFKSSLAQTNASLRKAFESKVDVPLFEKIKKVTVDDMFSMDSRIDVLLNAQEAKKIGLIDKITKLTPAKKAQIAALTQAASFQHAGATTPPIPIELPVTEPIISKNKVMTLAEFKAAHPEVFAQASAEGVAQERDRIGSLIPYLGADQEAVVGMMKSGATLSMTAMSELNVKMFAAAQLGVIAGKTTPAINTPELPVGAASPAAQAQADEQAQIIAFRNEARASLNVPLIPAQA